MRLISIAFAVALAAATGLAACRTSAWVQMLALMGCVLWTGKAFLIARHFRALSVGVPGRFLFFVALWPGMNARRFLLDRVPPPMPTGGAWRRGLLSTAAGAAFLALGAWQREHHAVLAGWLGLVGLAYVVFFGVFHLLSLAYQSAGIDAQPLFREPMQSKNLADLWGRRWNRGVHDLVLETAYAPIARHSAPLAAVAAFLLSGALHELVLSVPARGDYGFPTAYFAIQAAGVVLLRSPTGRRLGIDRGARAWNFGAVLGVGGLPLLFTPSFHQNVVHVLLRDIAALV